MEIFEKTTQLLNSSQIFVDESGQPVYRLLKELQWRFSNGFGPEKYFWLFGSLHLEKSILLLCGLLIEGEFRQNRHCVDYPLLEQTLWGQ